MSNNWDSVSAQYQIDIFILIITVLEEQAGLIWAGKRGRERTKHASQMGERTVCSGIFKQCVIAGNTSVSLFMFLDVYLSSLSHSFFFFFLFTVPCPTQHSEKVRMLFVSRILNKCFRFSASSWQEYLFGGEAGTWKEFYFHQTSFKQLSKEVGGWVLTFW